MNLKQFKASRFSSSPHLLLIGNPVGHSLSPLMHNCAAAYHDLSVHYYAVRVDPAELTTLASYLNNEQLRGANVTIPYKQSMLNYVDELDPLCRKIGAVNTLVKRDGRIWGYNTDIYGFCEPLQPYQQEIEDTRAIIFGTGGASKAIVAGLREMGIAEVLLVSRNPQNKFQENWPEFVSIISYDAWPSYADETSIFVNATPLGMEPDEHRSPVEKNQASLLSNKICYDIVYKPFNTTFLKRAKKVNAQTIQGLEMLIHQGSKAFELWTGNPFPIDKVRQELNDHFANAD